MTDLPISKEASLPELKSVAIFQKQIPEYLLTCNKHLRTIVKARRAAADRAHGTCLPLQRLLTKLEETYLSQNRSQANTLKNTNTVPPEPRTNTDEVEVQQTQPETSQSRQPRTETPQPDRQWTEDKPDPYQTINELTMQVQQLQLQQEQLKAQTSVVRPNPTVYTGDNMATPYQPHASSKESY